MIEITTVIKKRQGIKKQYVQRDSRIFGNDNLTFKPGD